MTDSMQVVSDENQNTENTTVLRDREAFFASVKAQREAEMKGNRLQKKGVKLNRERAKAELEKALKMDKLLLVQMENVLLQYETPLEIYQRILDEELEGDEPNVSEVDQLRSLLTTIFNRRRAIKSLLENLEASELEIHQSPKKTTKWQNLSQSLQALREMFVIPKTPKGRRLSCLVADKEEEDVEFVNPKHENEFATPQPGRSFEE